MRMKCAFYLVVFLLLNAVAFAADGDAHWGVQGDIAYSWVPDFVVGQIEDLPERPKIKGPQYQAGLVRLHPSGAPSYALQFSGTDLKLSGSLGRAGFVTSVDGTVTMRGLMATKYVNFATRRHWSTGLAFGGGVGKGEARYTRSLFGPNISRVVETESYESVIPLFEILARVDVRPVRFLTMGPYFGIRNGAFAAGGVVRLHFVK